MSTHKRFVLYDRLQQVRAQAAMGVAGYYKLVLRDLMGRPVLETPWKKNIITDQGLINMSNYDGWAYYMSIGSSAQAPAATDTGCIALLANMSSSRGYSNYVFNSSTPPYEMETTIGARFNAGVGTGTVREVTATGFSNYTNASSRFLVTPEIVKGVDQVLDVFYRARVERHPEDIITNGIDITEDSVSVLYDTIARGSQYSTITPSSAFRQMGIYQGTWTRCYSGPISADINGSPSGTQSGSSTITYPGSIVSITDGAYRDVNHFFTLDDMGVGIRSIRTRHDHNYDTQIQYTDQATGTRLIPKDLTKEIDFQMRTTWYRL